MTNEHIYLWDKHDFDEVGKTSKWSESGSVKRTGLDPELLTKTESSSSTMIGDVILHLAPVNFCLPLPNYCSADEYIGNCDLKSRNLATENLAKFTVICVIC